MLNLDNFVLIKGYTHYLIDEKGNIYSLSRNKLLKPIKNKDGYYRVCLCENNVRHYRFVHRLVALQFIPIENPELLVVNHKDGNKINNNVDNLEWVTSRENTLHAINMNLWSPCNDNNFNAKLSNEDVYKIRTMYKQGLKISEINKIYNNVTWENIKHIVTYKTFKNI